MIVSNTAGCTYFAKALQGSGSSLPATVASAATNYFCSVNQKLNLFYIVFTVYKETHFPLSDYCELCYLSVSCGVVTILLIRPKDDYY